MTTILLEDIVAIKNLPEILKVDGIDVFWVVPGDLAQSMGYTGQTNHPEVRAVMDKAIARHRQGRAARPAPCQRRHGRGRHRQGRQHGQRVLDELAGGRRARVPGEGEREDRRLHRLADPDGCELPSAVTNSSGHLRDGWTARPSRADSLGQASAGVSAPATAPGRRARRAVVHRRA